MSHHSQDGGDAVAAPTRDPAPLGGRARSELVYPVFLILALGADIGAFFQVVSIVMNLNEWFIAMVVVGFAAIVVFLAHVCGMLVRAYVSGGPPAQRRFQAVMVVVLGLVWLALGLIAFEVRRRNSPDSGPIEISAPGEPTSSVEAGAGDLTAAVLFIALYVGAGLTAMLGAYLTHDLAYGRYLAARRSHAKAVRALAVRAERHAYSEAELRAWQSWAERMDLVAEQHRFDRSRFGDELKSLARQRIAESSKDPAVTDAVLRPGRELGAGPQHVEWK